MLEALCTSKLDSQTLQVDVNIHVRFRKVALLCSCRVDVGERFGRLAHWSRLVEEIQAPHIVLYLTSLKEFFVASARARDTHEVNTRSAFCWLRDAAGNGFLFDEEHGVFRIEVSRHFFTDDEEEDIWGESLAHLLSYVSAVFPESTFDEN